jgi:hypothetical protein
MPRPLTLAEVAQRRNAGEDFSLLLREFLDEFYGAERRGDAAACIADEPERVSNAQEHASLGAVGEHLARRWNLPIPCGRDHSRFLHARTSRRRWKGSARPRRKPYCLPPLPIFTEVEPLRRARMPTDPHPG